MNHLREFDRKESKFLTQGLIKNPREYLDPLQRALQDVSRNIKISTDEVRVGLLGSVGENFVTPRTLSSRFLNQIVCLDGIVTKTSLVHPKLVESDQFCAATNRHFREVYTDDTALNEIPRRIVLRTEDADGNALEMEFGLSVFIDHQVVSLQERPESSPAGQMSRTCQVIADHDLADACKPGDRVLVYGVYKIFSKPTSSGLYKGFLIANSIQISTQTLPNISQKDVEAVQRVRKMAKRSF